MPADPTAAAYRSAFVREVQVRRERRRPGRFFYICWALILLKCLFAWWAIGHWEMPVSAAWVWMPSVFIGAVATFYLLHGEE
ncbi:MAG: hypothetical protein EA425_16495 [Puniceicoccaceae bacterium]|nr:MAG: hypothetical protein EA425_16495 [Puniceicoccaceae bacterium]